LYKIRLGGIRIVGTLDGDMKHTLLTVSLLSAAAALSAQSAGSPKMSYDFIRAGYVQGEEIRGVGISGTALLGEYVLIGGSYQDLTARNLDDVDGEANTVNLGARFGVGSGDIIISASYGQLQAGGVDGGSAVALAANVTSLGFAYRHSFNDMWEAFVSYDRVRTEYGAGSVDLYSGDAYIGAASQSDNMFGVAVRCNVTKEFDVTAGYSWVDGEGALSISAGYNF
jgi:hypothetical protein